MDNKIQKLNSDVEEIKKQLKDIEAHGDKLGSEEFLTLMEQVLVRILRKDEELSTLRSIKNALYFFGPVIILLAGFIIFLVMFTEPI